LNELCFFGHAPNPPVGFNSHSENMCGLDLVWRAFRLQRRRAGMSIKGKEDSDK
jgi:hypothetical protein